MIQRDWEIILGYMGDMVGVTGRLWWGMYLAKPNTFTMFLTNERGRQERQRQRNWDDGSRAWGASRWSTAGFDDGGRGHEPRKAGHLSQLGKARK